MTVSASFLPPLPSLKPTLSSYKHVSNISLFFSFLYHNINTLFTCSALCSCFFSVFSFQLCTKACAGNLEGDEGCSKMRIRKENHGWKIDFSGKKPATPLLDTINYPLHMKNLSTRVTSKTR